MLNALLARLPIPKARVRATYYALKERYVNMFRAYGEAELLAAVRSPASTGSVASRRRRRD
jgi:hypothetical protein